MRRATIFRTSSSLRCRGQESAFSRSIRSYASDSSGNDGKRLQKTYSFMNVNSKLPRSSSIPGFKSAKNAEDAVNNLLYNVSKDIPREKKHTLSVFVDNEAGVLSKVSGLLSARGFNIDSLSVANTEVSDLSRMTIVLKGPEAQMEQAKRQLQDLCDVWAVFDFQPESTVHKELCLVKVSCIPPTMEPSFSRAEEMNSEVRKDNAGNNMPSTEELEEQRNVSYDKLMAVHFHRQALQEIAALFNAEAVDIGSETIMYQLVAWPERIDAFLNILRPYKIVEAARTGVIAMARSKVMPPEGHVEDITPRREEVNAADLPPS